MSTRRFVLLIMAALMMLTVPVTSVAAASHQPVAASPQALPTQATNTFDNLPVHGTTPGGGTFTGLLDISKFKLVNGALTAVGSLTGTLRNSVGDVVGTVVGQRVQLPVAVGGASTCDILHLKLGPLDLNLLGLNVHLNRVVLDITATAGPGNLLGNLLCAVAHLLDSGLSGQGLNAILRDLLNSILGVLNL